MVCIALCFLFSLASLAGWIAHQYVVETADYFAFPPEFWSAVFFTLFIAFGLEGFLRWRRAGVA